MNRRKTKATPRSTDVARVVETQDKMLTFRLTRGSNGVYVERVQRRGASTLAHSAVFFTREDFAAFCDTDELRFEYQLTYVQLRKTFEELFDADDRETAPPHPARNRH